MAKTISGSKARPGPAKAKPLPKVSADGKTIRAPLTQNPHAIRDTREKVLEVAIGREVRAFRKKLGITVADLAVATDISLGMLSKIENGITSPSLTTLQALSRALGVPVTAFFRRFEEERSAVFVKAGEGRSLYGCSSRLIHECQCCPLLNCDRRLLLTPLGFAGVPLPHRTIERPLRIAVAFGQRVTEGRAAGDDRQKAHKCNGS